MNRVNLGEMEPQVSVETVENPEPLALQETGMALNTTAMLSTYFNNLVYVMRLDMRTKELKDTY